MKSRGTQKSPRRRLLAVHGFTGEPYDFAPLYESGELDVDWRFVTLPGHHREWCPVPRSNDGTGWQQFGERIAEIVHEAAADGVCLSALGYSMGARLLLRAQLANRWALDSLLLIGGSAGLESASHRNERWESDQRWAALLRTQGIEPFIEQWLRQPLLQRQGINGLDGRLRRKRLLEPEALARSLLDFSNGKLDPVWDRLPGLQTPVHLIAGAEDLKFCQLHQRMHTLLPHGSRHELPGLGHAPHLEAPDLVLPLLAELLSR